jgi:hypothetical protein
MAAGAESYPRSGLAAAAGTLRGGKNRLDRGVGEVGIEPIVEFSRYRQQLRLKRPRGVALCLELIDVLGREELELREPRFDAGDKRVLNS